LKIYAASVVIIANDEIDHHLFTFSLRKDAERTPEEKATEIAKSLLPEDGECNMQLKIMSVDLKTHFEQYAIAEMQA
jgi:hypothetical protein